MLNWGGRPVKAEATQAQAARSHRNTDSPSCSWCVSFTKNISFPWFWLKTWMTFSSDLSHLDLLKPFILDNNWTPLFLKLPGEVTYILNNWRANPGESKRNGDFWVQMNRTQLYFELLLWRTVFGFPWEFKIAGFSCVRRYLFDWFLSPSACPCTFPAIVQARYNSIYDFHWRMTMKKLVFRTWRETVTLNEYQRTDEALDYRPFLCFDFCNDAICL